jgi:hypothetical protein
MVQGLEQLVCQEERGEGDDDGPETLWPQWKLGTNWRWCSVSLTHIGKNSWHGMAQKEVGIRMKDAGAEVEAALGAGGNGQLREDARAGVPGVSREEQLERPALDAVHFRAVT